MKRQKNALKPFIDKLKSTLLICIGLFMSVQSYAQDQTISVKGVVKDPLGEAIIGANIREKGTGSGTITDLDGNFSLKVSAKGTLLISFIGYADQEIPVANKTFFNVTLKEDSKVLDEVVVVG